MPCRTGDTPTERIARLLDEILELEDYADQLVQWSTNPAEAAMPVKPPLQATIAERARIRFTANRNRAARERMQRLRLVGQELGVLRPTGQGQLRVIDEQLQKTLNQLTTEEIEEMLAKAGYKGG